MRVVVGQPLLCLVAESCHFAVFDNDCSRISVADAFDPDLHVLFGGHLGDVFHGLSVEQGCVRDENDAETGIESAGNGKGDRSALGSGSLFEWNSFVGDADIGEP